MTSCAHSHNPADCTLLSSAGLLLLAFALAVLFGSNCSAQTNPLGAQWVGGTTGSWFDASNWLCGSYPNLSPCVPNASMIVGVEGTGTGSLLGTGAGPATAVAIGGTPSTGLLGLANEAGGGNVLVEGGATGTSNGIDIGSSCFTCGTSSLNLMNAGTTWTNTGDVFVGGDLLGELNVNDSAKFTTSGQLTVGDEGAGIMTIEGGGIVTDASGQIQFTFNSGSTGIVQVVGPGSSWINATTLSVGGAGSADLTVQNGGTVSAQTIAISPFGLVDAKGGTLQGTVINNGTLDPLGTATINGDYTQGVNGTLILDVAGTGAGDFGQLDVSGNATFDGTIQFDFINGFAPSKGDTFDFINVGGSADFSGATIDIGGLLPGFDYSDSFANGQFILTALNNGVASSPTPEPGTILLFGTALLGLACFSRLRRREGISLG